MGREKTVVDKTGMQSIKGWCYPVSMKDAGEDVGIDRYLAAIRSNGGSYPLGVNGFLHGGVHLAPVDADGAVSGGVRCIADGEVVAYKIDQDYQRLLYPEEAVALYSTGFTLIRHKLTLPPVPSPGGTTHGKTTMSKGAVATMGEVASDDTKAVMKDTASTMEGDSIIFFSLYMHLAPASVYKANRRERHKKVWPYYYGAVEIWTVTPKAATRSQRGTGAGEPLMGVYVHKNKRGGLGVPIGLLPLGSHVTIIQSHDLKRGLGKIETIMSGEVASLDPGGVVASEARHGLVSLQALASKIHVRNIGEVCLPTTPMKVSAGDLVGYPGEYQDVEHTSALPPTPKNALVHVEVFAGDELRAFIDRSRQRAAILTNEPRTKLWVENGASLYKPMAATLRLPARTVVTVTSDAPRKGIWTKVTVAAGGTEFRGRTFWILRSVVGNDTLPRDAWSEFPLSLSGEIAGTVGHSRIMDVSRGAAAYDDGRNAWYPVDVGNAAMETVHGYVCASGQPHVSLHNRWAWPGFEMLTCRLSNKDLFMRHLYLQGGPASDREQSALVAGFNDTRADALIAKLDEILVPEGQPRGEVQGADLLTAVNEPWKADRINHLITRYETEWGGGMEKWDAIDSLMNGGLPYWQTEKARIEKLRIWEACESVLGDRLSLTVYHVHPIRLCMNFASYGFRFTALMLQQIFPLAKVPDLQAVCDELNAHIHFYQLDTPLRRSHFFAQIRQEVGTYFEVEERFVYKSSVLVDLFRNFTRHPEEARKHGYDTVRPYKADGKPMTKEDFVAIANRAYGDRGELGNGSMESGDGWKFRGRGLKHVTGRGGYQKFSDWHIVNQHRWPGDVVDFIENPEALIDMKYAARSAAFFWISNSLASIADLGADWMTAALITDVINKKTDSRDKRYQHFERIFNNKLLF
ncbi:glycoside hydrolase family 19 protein [Robbsia andropogonis]|uniref:glycoside hydrolase family 19 protein n=1 Tax=Robbsia andropogonis TaxID=28092 RepID=UPI000A683989|nr:hypothetical protein [Robbsia andropogonis]